MHFERIEVKDFLSFQDATLDLNNRGLVLVKGENHDSDSSISNGAGKSTLIVEAILWGLFGKTAREVRSDAVIRKGQKRASVRIVWTSHSRRFSCTRTQPSGLIFETETDDGQAIDLTRTDKRLTQKDIETTLGFDFSLALYALVLGQKSLSFTDATDAEKKRVLEVILDFETYNTAALRAKTKVEEIDGKIRDDQVGLSKLQQTIDSSTAQIATLQHHETTFDHTRTEQIVTYEKQIEGLRESATQLDLRHAKVHGCQEAVGKLVEDVTYLDMLQGELEAIPREVGHLENTMGMAKSFVDQLHTGVSTNETKCAQCGQILPLDQLDGVKRRQQERKVDVQKYEAEIVQTRLHLNYLEVYKEVTEACVVDLVMIPQQQIVYHRALELATAELRDSEGATSELKGHDAHLTKIREATNPYTTQIPEHKTTLATASDTHRKLTTQLKSHEVLRAHYEFWVKGFGKKGLQSFLLEAVIPYLTQQANLYAFTLCGGDVTIEFSSTSTIQTGDIRETLSINCVNSTGAETYKGQSGGEQDRINMAVALALQDLVQSRLGIDLNYAVFDECVPFTDREGIDRVMQLLEELKTRRSTIFFVSHNPLYEDYFVRSFTVVKKDGVSSLQD